MRPRNSALPFWGPARKALALAIGFRLLYSLIAALWSPSLYLNAGLIRSNKFTEHLMQRADHPTLYSLFGVWERFDTLWYLHIANHGYDMAQAAVFYPLYPALIRLLSMVTRWDLLSALLVTNIATFFLYWGALRLFELHTSRRNAFRAVLLWSVFPDSFIFFAGYPDSLMLALTVWSIYFASRRDWGPAGVLGLLAGCAKAFGCLSLIPILYLGWRYRDRRACISAALTLAGTASFQLWLLANHFPSTSRIYETYWATTTSAPWNTISLALHRMAHSVDLPLMLNFGVLVLVLAAGFVARVPVEYRIFALSVFLVIATKNTVPVFQSSVRYSLALFAAFPAIADWIENNVYYSLVLLPALFLNLFLLRVCLDWGLLV